MSLGVQPTFAAVGIQAVSPVVQKASDLGAVDPALEMNLTVYVNSHNQAAFDKAVDALYDPESATYHQWMTDQDLAKYAPTAADVTAVEKELQKHGLSVISTDPNGFFVRVHGTAAQVQQAFQTQIHNLSVNGKTFFAHVQNAQLTGTAGSLVGSVVGLTQGGVKPMYKRATNPRTGAAPAPISMSKAQAVGLGGIITTRCLQPPAVEEYTTAGASLPVGVYFGTLYNPPLNANGIQLVCDFTASQLQAHYGLTAAYKQGLNGAGQTIVLLEAYGYPTMMQDANAFSTLMGLPLLNNTNFSVVYPEGVPNPTVGVLLGWDIEIALDIQWAHSMAPGAKILVVATYGQDSEDFQASMNYIISNKLGTVVSDSWEEDTDLFAGPAEQDSFNTILKKAAAKGISFQFSSGDGGDDGLGSPVGSSEVPSNSPYATGVGGTSILNNPSGTGQWEVGWGDDVTYIALGGVVDPPLPLGFLGGAGGGESVYYAKPAWQSKLSGTGRQSPDVSALADPYTGVPIVITAQGIQYLEAGWGGTSLASPIVTAILAIATQKAGKALGQAAPLVASLAGGTTGAVTDILPLTSPTNLAGTIFDSNGPTYYSPASFFAPFLYTTQGFISVDYPLSPGPLGVAGAFAFGIDSSLTVTTGWDNVTGYGVPNGLTFINAISK
jgi:subtilase family serine protease